MNSEKIKVGDLVQLNENFTNKAAIGMIGKVVKVTDNSVDVEYPRCSGKNTKLEYVTLVKKDINDFKTFSSARLLHTFNGKYATGYISGVDKDDYRVSITLEYSDIYGCQPTLTLPFNKIELIG